MTSGSSGKRLSTGGSLPALTSSASAGASANFFGHFAGSRTSSGPSSLPMSWAPSFGAAPPAGGGEAAVAGQDGADAGALGLGRGRERRGRETAPQAEHRARGLERGQPVAVGVQVSEILDDRLRAKAAGHVAARRRRPQLDEE